MAGVYEIPISSENTGIANFLISELIIMAYVMFITGVISGALNHKRLSAGKDLNLKVFDFPHIGGGLVMNKSPARTALILLRLLTLVAIAVSNFGLEGRSTPVIETREATVRQPGDLGPANTTIVFNATERQRRCVRTEGGELRFGAVIDDTCYPSVTDGVYISGMSLNFTKFNKSATGCSIERIKIRLLTVYRCEDVDMSCLGLFMEGDEVERGRCHSVIYDSEGIWMCPVHSVRPGVEGEVSCRRIYARREDVSLWPDVFWTYTLDLEASLFASAYGQEERRQVSVPTGNTRNITVVTLFWLIPAVVQVVVVCIGTVWAIIVRRKGTKAIFNDEAGLAKFIELRDGVMVIRAEAAYWDRMAESSSV